MNGKGTCVRNTGNTQETEPVSSQYIVYSPIQKVEKRIFMCSHSFVYSRSFSQSRPAETDDVTHLDFFQPPRIRSTVISDENLQLSKNNIKVDHRSYSYTYLACTADSFLTLSKLQSNFAHSLAVPGGRECSLVNAIGHGNYDVKLHSLPSERCAGKHPSYCSRNCIWGSRLDIFDLLGFSSGMSHSISSVCDQARVVY